VPQTSLLESLYSNNITFAKSRSLNKITDESWIDFVLGSWNMKKLLVITVLGLFLTTTSQADNSVEIYLLNQLDDPRGFCIDIKGHK